MNLSMELINSQRRDVTWKYNGKPKDKVPGDLKSPVRLFDSVSSIRSRFLFFSIVFSFCRKLPLHDSLDRHGQRHRCTDGGGRKNFQPRHLQCQLRGGQPPQRSLDEAHRQRFAGSQRSCAKKKNTHAILQNPKQDLI